MFPIVIDEVVIALSLFSLFERYDHDARVSEQR